jgi:hypothetical protein
MKVLVLYRPNSEEARTVESFVHDFQSRHEAGRLEVLDVNTRDGYATATLYDVMSYPAILVLRDDGSILKSWEGDMLPLMDEIAYYTYSGGN